jgi:penicillin-binding protein 2
MVQFYAALAGDGREQVPHVVRRQNRSTRSLGLSDAHLDGLRRSLIAVVERGTAAASRRGDLAVAGKTGTAQNPHGKDHGWFIGFAPADRPEMVVGAIMEFAEHGTTVAPYVVRVLRRSILGPEPPAEVPTRVKIVAPADTAPRAIELDPDSAAARAVADSIRRLGDSTAVQ